MISNISDIYIYTYYYYDYIARVITMIRITIMNITIALRISKCIITTVYHGYIAIILLTYIVVTSYNDIILRIIINSYNHKHKHN